MQGTHYVYTLIVSEPETMTFQKVEKVIKINMSNISKIHAHASDHDRNTCTFSKILAKPVWGVTDTRYILSESAET